MGFFELGLEELEVMTLQPSERGIVLRFTCLVWVLEGIVGVGGERFN